MKVIFVYIESWIRARGVYAKEDELRKYRMNYEDINTKIDELLLDGPVMDIHHYEQARNTYELIANNAETLNDAGYGGFFGHIQNTLLTDMILRVCRMFESFRNHEMRTFPCILDIMKNNADILLIYQPDVEEPIMDERIRQAMRGVKSSKRGGLIAVPMPSRPVRVANVDKTLELVETVEYSMPKGGKPRTNELSEFYMKLKTQRNKEVAHNELIDPSKIDRPTFDMLEELVWWAKKAIGRIRNLVLPEVNTFSPDGRYSLSRDAKYSCHTLQKMLQELGVPLVEKDSEAYVKMFKEHSLSD